MLKGTLLYLANRRPVYRLIMRHDLLNQKWEHAAASHEGTWIRNVWIENPHKAHCIYCRIFEHADRDGQ